MSEAADAPWTFRESALPNGRGLHVTLSTPAGPLRISDVLSLLASNPFPEGAPKWIRAELFEYKLTTLKDRGAGWWTIFKVIGALILIPSLIFFAGTMVMLFTEDNKGVGIAAVFISIIPAGIGSMLYAIGANAGKETICGNCGENVGKHALICKTCQARLAG